MAQAEVVTHLVRKDHAVLRRLPPIVVLIFLRPNAVHMNPAGPNPSLASIAAVRDIRGHVDLDQIVGGRTWLQDAELGVCVGLHAAQRWATLCSHGHAGDSMASSKRKGERASGLLLISGVEFSDHVRVGLGCHRGWRAVDRHRDNGHVVAVWLISERADVTVPRLRHGQGLHACWGVQVIDCRRIWGRINPV